MVDGACPKRLQRYAGLCQPRSGRTSTLLRPRTQPRLGRGCVAHARISTNEQTLALQLDAAAADGSGKVVPETTSGAKAERTVLADVHAYLRTVETLVVWRLDRLGRADGFYPRSWIRASGRSGRGWRWCRGPICKSSPLVGWMTWSPVMCRMGCYRQSPRCCAEVPKGMQAIVGLDPNSRRGPGCAPDGKGGA